MRATPRNATGVPSYMLPALCPALLPRRNTHTSVVVVPKTSHDGVKANAEKEGTCEDCSDAVGQKKAIEDTISYAFFLDDTCPACAANSQNGVPLEKGGVDGVCKRHVALMVWGEGAGGRA